MGIEWDAITSVRIHGKDSADLFPYAGAAESVFLVGLCQEERSWGGRLVCVAFTGWEELEEVPLRLGRRGSQRGSP